MLRIFHYPLGWALIPSISRVLATRQHGAGFGAEQRFWAGSGREEKWYSRPLAEFARGLDRHPRFSLVRECVYPYSAIRGY